jgi:hypothetical protein
VLEFSGGPKGRFFPSIKGIAKHFGHRGVSAQEMHLKTMCLLFCARLRVDAPNIWF